MIAALLIVMALLLAGCGAGAPTVLPSQTPAASQSAAATATAAPTSRPDAQQAFGGDCAGMFTVEQLSETLGLPMQSLPRAYSLGTAEVHGGLQCTWGTAEVYMGITVSAIALPASEVPETFVEGEVCRDDVYGGPCQVTVIDDGVWYRLSFAMTVTGPDHAAVAHDLARRLVDHGHAMPRPVAPPVAAGTWTLLPACADVAARITPDTAPSAGSAVGGDVAPVHDTAGPDLWSALGRQTCVLTFTTADGAPSTITATFSPGGGSTYEAALAASGDVSRMATSSGEAAVAAGPSVWEGDGQGMYATDGVNTILLTTSYGSAFPTSEIGAPGGLIDQLFSAVDGS